MEDREENLKRLCDMAWGLQRRELFDLAIKMARTMGQADGAKEASDALDAALAKKRS